MSFYQQYNDARSRSPGETRPVLFPVSSPDGKSRPRAGTPADGRVNPKDSDAQQTTAQSITPYDDRLKEKRWDNTPEMERFVAALCATPRVGRRWMENVARTAAAIGKPPQFTTELITKMLHLPAYPSEVADVVAAAYAQHGGVECE